MTELFTQPHFKKFKLDVHSHEWYQFRTTGIPGMSDGGIGASEIAKVIGGIDQYRPSLAELYHQKIGTAPLEPISNPAIMWGIIMEDEILKAWSCYASEEDYVDRYLSWRNTGFKDDSIPLRTYDPCNYYLVNEKYPHLFISLDAAIPAGQANFHGEILDKPSPLEIKTISYWAAKQYELGLPTKYIYQLHQQMIVTEADYGEIAILKDGRNLEVFPFERNERICNQIIEYSERFWNDRVLPAREAFEEVKTLEQSNLNSDEPATTIQHLEPEPDNTDAYKEFMLERYQTEQESIKGSLNMFKSALEYQRVKEIMKVLDKKKKGIYNDFLKELVHSEAAFVDFGKNGKVTISEKTKRLTFSKIKSPDKETIEQKVNETLSR